MLSVDFLYGNLLDLFINGSRDNVTSATRIADAYAQYAKAAQGPQLEPIILKGFEQEFLKSVLISISSVFLPPFEAAQQIGNAIIGFWLSPPVVTSIGGACSSVLPLPGILTLQTSQASSQEDGARILSNALHQMTQTVLIVEPSPFPPGLII